MTPRALADETSPLLKPDSCQAIALARLLGTPLAAAICAICDDVTCSLVAYGAACGTTADVGTGAEALDGVPAPVGSLSTVPASSTPFGSRPFMNAIWSAVTP